MPTHALSPEFQTARRLAGRLDAAAIPYAFLGRVAVQLHGGKGVRPEVEVLLTPQGLACFKSDYVGATYAEVRGTPRRFVDREDGVPVNVRVTGRHPGLADEGPIVYPDPQEAGLEIEGIRVVRLPQLIQLNLAGRRSYDCAGVVSLISAHNLDESFLDQLNPSVHRAFVKCLDEKRRQDQFEAES